MVAAVLLLALVFIATVTDVRSHKIYNWTTYPGILIALARGAVVSSFFDNPTVKRLLGEVTFRDAGLGFLACGGIMLVCYVFFRIGGGDVKLLAMVGAFLGVEGGIRALLWTLIIGGALALIVLVWRVGTFKLIKRFVQYVVAALRLRGFKHIGSLGPEAQTSLYLAPSALVAAVIVLAEQTTRMQGIF